MKNNSVIGIVVGVVLVGAIGMWALSMNNSTQSPSPTASPSESVVAQSPKATKNIVELASSDPQFSTLVTAVKQLGWLRHTRQLVHTQSLRRQMTHLPSFQQVRSTLYWLIQPSLSQF